MNIFLESVVTLFKVFKSIVVAVFYTFVERRMKAIDDEIVLITGAGSGIGRLMCVEFAKRGAHVVAWDVNKAGNEETCNIVKEKGGSISGYLCDVSNRDAVFKTAEKVTSEVGNVDILVNNAGIVSGNEFLDIPDDLVEKTIDVNMVAHFWTVKAFLPYMIQRNHGHIVTVASVAGIFGCNGMADYCASKFGSVGFAESLMYELAARKHNNVHSTIVCPYFMNTGMFDGCQTKFPSLLPMLDPKESVEKIMKAVLTNQPILMMPRTMYFLHVLKTLLPYEAGVVLNKFFGATDFMATFKGRAKRD